MLLLIIVEHVVGMPDALISAPFLSLWCRDVATGGRVGYVWLPKVVSGSVDEVDQGVTWLEQFLAS